MAESQGVVGMNTQVKIGSTDSPASFVLVAEPTDIDGPEITQEYADFTHMQSTGGFREKKPTFKSSGTVTFSCAYVNDDPGQMALVAAAQANPATLQYFSLTYPDASIITFAAFPSVKFRSEMAGKFSIAVTLNLEGSFDID